MTLTARLLCLLLVVIIKASRENFENKLQVMHFDKTWHKKNDRLHI